MSTDKMSTDKISDKTVSHQLTDAHDKFVHERTTNPSSGMRANELKSAQKTVDSHLGHLEITNDVKPARDDVRAPQSAAPEREAQVPLDSQPAWQKNMSNDLTHAWNSISDTASNALNAVEKHYQNPYGKGWDADWADLQSPAPIDRRVLDTFKAIYDGPKEVLDRLKEAMER
jgi:hypothetical protein